MPKLKGVICNIAISVNELLSTLLRTLDSSGIIPVKLIKALGFSEYVYFKPVWTEKKNYLPYFKKSSLYNNVTINLDNMPAGLLFLVEDDEMNMEEEINDLTIDSSEKNHRNNYTSSFFICELSAWFPIFFLTLSCAREKFKWKSSFQTNYQQLDVFLEMRNAK